MAKFCTNCGKELKEGEKCSCCENKTEATQAVSIKENKNNN